jgi:hypothetical protein
LNADCTQGLDERFLLAQHIKAVPFVRLLLEGCKHVDFRLSGMSGLEIMFRELMPHMIPWLSANFVNAFIAAILAKAGLSILGLGPQSQMTLGMMIYWSTINTSSVLQNLCSGGRLRSSPSCSTSCPFI